MAPSNWGIRDFGGEKTDDTEEKEDSTLIRNDMLGELDMRNFLATGEMYSPVKSGSSSK